MQLGNIISPFISKVTGEHNFVVLTSSRSGIQKQSDHFSRDQRHDTEGYNVIPYGYCTYRNRSDDGRFTFNINDKVDSGIVSKFYPVFSFHDSDPTFMVTFLNTSPRAVAAIFKQAVGTSQVVLSFSALKEMVIPLPKLDEQKKISVFIQKLDDRIRAQTRLVESLKSYKRGVVKHLLATEPSEGWICDKIGNIGVFHKGAALSKADIREDGQPMILYGELYTTYNEVVSTVVRKTQATVDDVFISRVGDVVMPTSGETPEEISTASCVMLPGVILAGDLLIYRSSKVDGRIMSYALNHIINDRIARIAQGKSVVHVQSSEIGKVKIALPPLKLQSKYADYLDRLSLIIRAEEKCNEQLLLLKASLLQQMFV